MYLIVTIHLDRPERPVIEDAVNITSNSAVLLWLEPPDNNAPLLGYWIVYYTPNESHYIPVGPQTSYNVTDLKPAMTYHFTLVAFNSIGSSLSSLGIDVTTLEAGKAIL